MQGISLSGASKDQLDRISVIETASYPPDEPASHATLDFRMTKAPDFFLVASTTSDHALGAGHIGGYACGTLAKGDTLTHNSMQGHDPEGKLLCVHSVVVEEQHRRKGLGTFVLTEYIKRVKALDGGKRVSKIALICKELLINFYKGCGFELVGLSPVVHGKDPWYEMIIKCE